MFPVRASSIALLGALAMGDRAAADPIDAATASPGLYAVFQTTSGDFVCRLEPEKAPVTVGSFVGLAEGTREFKDPRSGQMVKRPFYDGLKFHRIVRDFVVQGGDPFGDGSGGPGYEFIDEVDSTLHFKAPGMLAMANAGRDRNGSQFFLTLAPAPHLDGQHTIFGHVVMGMEVLQDMARQPCTGPDHSTPVTDITMRSVRIVRRGPAAEAFDAAAAFAQQDQIRARLDEARRATQEEFHAQLERDKSRAVRTPSGLMYVVLERGKGDPPKPGDTVATQCTGYLAEDGRRFWSTRDRGEPFRVAIGVDKVIKAWEEAYLGMRPGEKRRLIVPPELGYGATGNPRVGIPGGATLVFDIELLSIERH